MKRRIIASTSQVIELDAELFYDTVHNIQNAGWDDILSFFQENGWVSGNALTIPEGTTLTQVGKDRNYTYFSVDGPNSSIELPLTYESLSEIVDN